MDEARLIEVVQEHLQDRVTRDVALRSGAVSRSFIRRLERRLYMNPRTDRYIELCTSIGLDVYAFATRIDSGKSWAAELRHQAMLESGSPSRFARAHGIPQTNMSAWCRGEHYPRLRVALRILRSFGSYMTVRARG